MKDVAVCLTHFKSLGLANLEAALYSLRQQDMTRIGSIAILDNDSNDLPEAIRHAIDALEFNVPVWLRCIKHRDPTKTHSWSTNQAMRMSTLPWVFFTRSDYILDFDLLECWLDVVTKKPGVGFVTSHMRHLNADIGVCDATEWRMRGTPCLRGLPGADADYTEIDAGVWLARRDAIERVGGMDESLTAWGHAQTHFQYKLHKSGVQFTKIADVLFYHPKHSAPRDITVAHQQLQDAGVDLKEMWKRYEGVSPY